MIELYKYGKKVATLTEDEIKKLLTNIDECQTYPELFNKFKKVLG